MILGQRSPCDVYSVSIARLGVTFFTTVSGLEP